MLNFTAPMTQENMHCNFIAILYFKMSSDMSLLISLAGENLQLLYNHTLQLRSPIFTSSSSTCLQLTFAALSYFSVRLGCVKGDKTYVERLLFRYLMTKQVLCPF
jgi:hypothetical protein